MAETTDAPVARVAKKASDAGRPPKHFRCAVFTALSVENAAARQLIDGTPKQWKLIPNLRNARTGKVGNNQILLCEAEHDGNVQMGILVSTIMSGLAHQSDLEIDAFVLLGIAGGMPGRVELGDVVIGDSIWEYDRGRMTDEGYQPKGHHPGLRKVPSNPKWQPELRLGDKLLWSPTLRAGGLASGETVVKSREFRDQLLGNSERTDILAIEMESVGFIKALEAGDRLKSGVVIKAIVDYCDENKSDHWHRAGASIAADVLEHFITHDLLPKK